jgi:hypothetical protein
MFDTISFLNDYNIQYITQGSQLSQGWVGVCCPMCNDDKFHMGISPDGHVWTCWRCGRLQLHKLIREWLTCDKSTARQVFKEYADSTPSGQPLAKNDKRASSVELPGGSLQAPHKRYLKSRGFDPDFLERKYKITGTGPICKYDGQDFSLSLIIPVYNRTGKLISFQARDITGKKEMRYKGLKAESSVVPYKETLYNLNNVDSDTVVLVEGPFDVMRGGNNFVASFGTSLKPSQLRELKDYRKVFVLFDGEDHTQKKAQEYAKQLACLGVSVENICLEDQSKDVGDLSSDEVFELKRELGIL